MSARLASLLFLTSSLLTGFATEKTLWRLGEPDHSDHEFASGNIPHSAEGLVIHIGNGNEAKQWPRFHPGSGNGATGGRPYRYTLEFELPSGLPAGTFYLDLSLLFRQPRVPALELEINGHRGRYYFEPEPMFELGAVEDEFNVTRSAARRKIALPATLFQPGENRLAITAIDDPAVVITNRNVGGNGDAGFFYDALALSHDPDARFAEQLSASVVPTVFYLKTAQGVKERCDLIVKYPTSWVGGRARVTIGNWASELPVPKIGELGEARYSFLVPPDLPAGRMRLELFSAAQGSTANAAHVCDASFTPARKWKVFYAPNEHLDIGYTDYRAKVAEVHARCMDELMKALAAHPNYRFNLDGSWIVDQWLELRTSTHTAQLLPQARAGRVGVNAFYCSVATEYPSLEENIRNLYFSKELQERCGTPFDYALVSDVPSVSWSVPSVLASAGVRYFANGGNQDRGPMQVNGRWNARSPFWWEGPDGQCVLSWFSAHYHQFKALFGLPPAIESGQGGLARFLRTYETPDYAPDAVLIYGTEVENLPTEYDDAAFVDRWNAQFAWPQLIACQFSDFFRYIEKNYATSLPVVHGTGGAYWADNFGMLVAATARDRANQMRAVAAESLATLTTSFDPKLKFSRDLDREIWRSMLIYAEHNFGTGRAATQPEFDEVVGIVREKEDQTVQAEADIDKLMRRGLSQLAEQIRTEGQNLIVFNPLNWNRSGLVRFQVDAGTVLTNVATGQPIAYEVLAEKDGIQTIRFWAQDVLGLGYRVYRLGHGRTQHLTQPSEPQDNIVENRFYKVVLEPGRAAIKSLFDKQLGRELVDTSSPYLLNEYLFVSGGGTETGRGRGVEDSQLLHPFKWLPYAELTIHHPEQGHIVGVERTPWGQRIRLAASALHTPRLEVEILLPDDKKEVRFCNVIQVDLVYAKQASYFAFPWSIPKGAFRYDIPNGFVAPATDLLKGGCSDWFAVQHLVNIEDDKTSVSLATAEAPLVCLGDINRGYWAPQFTNRSSTVFSYALNNYWSVKWAGKKEAELHYRYAVTSGPRFDPAQDTRWACELRSPLEVAALKSSDKLPGLRGKLPVGQAALASVEPGNVMLTALKPAEDGHGIVVRLLEAGGREAEGTIRLPFLHIDSAREANAVEVTGKSLPNDGDSVHFHIKPHEILTVRISTRPKPGS